MALFLKLGFVLLVLLCVIAVFPGLELLPRCAPLRNSPLSMCSLAGYNHSYPLPKDLSKRSISSIKSSVRFIMKKIQNCSIGGIAETMACSFIAPNCNGTGEKPFLPCRRVCSEFLKRCEERLPDFLVDMMIALCSILPNSTAIQGTCYEPPNFHYHYNSTTMGPLERGCAPMIIPFCQDIGYTHTMITVDRQKTLYRHMYRKNYTDDAKTAKPAPRSEAEKLLNLTQSLNPTCAFNIRRLFCAEHIPPCFQEKGLSYYTACQDVCMNISRHCPELFDTHYNFFFYCEKLAYGDPYKGYCRHTDWPKPMQWIDIFTEPHPPTKRPMPSGVDGGAIAAIIVVPVVIVGLIIALVFMYKKRKLPSRGYVRQQDDKVELVT